MEVLLIICATLIGLAVFIKVSGFFLARTFPNLAEIYRNPNK